MKIKLLWPLYMYIIYYVLFLIDKCSEFDFFRSWTWSSPGRVHCWY